MVEDNLHIELIEQRIDELETIEEDIDQTVKDMTNKLDAQIKLIRDELEESIDDVVDKIKNENKRLHAEAKDKINKLEASHKDTLKAIKKIADAVPGIDEIVDNLVKVSGEKFKLSTKNIDGLDQTIAAFSNQLGNNKTYLHGGGDTVTAGTNVTITTNTAGQKVISATGTGGGVWGSITGTLSDQTDLQTALDAKITANTPITGDTKTKITYDTDGLVTSGADATTADIADSTNKRYVTDAQLTVIGNTSGTNTGDQTSIAGITGTKSQYNTSVTDGDFLFVGDITQYTDEMAQDAVGSMVDSTLVYTDVTPLLSRAALTGDVTASTGSNATTIANNAVTTAKIANFAITDAKVNDVDWAKITFTPTTLAGYGITDAITGLTTGTTSITSGTNTKVLYNNSGVLGEYTISGSGNVAMTTSPTFSTDITTPLIIGGTGTTSTLTFRTTSGVGTTNADMIFQVGNNGATEAMRITNGGFVGIGTTPTTKFSVVQTDGFGTYVDPLGVTVNSFMYLNPNITTSTFGTPMRVMALETVVNPSSDPGTKTVNGIVSQVTVPSGSVNLSGVTMRGLNFTVQHGGTGSINALVGLLGNATNRSTGTVTTATGGQLTFNNLGAGTITTAYGMLISDISNAGTITNTYGVYVGDITTGTQTNTPFSFYASDANTLNYFAGRTGIGTSTPAASAILDLTSTTGAFLPPRMTTAQRDALTAVDGMMIYNTTLATMQYRKAGSWVSI